MNNDNKYLPVDPDFIEHGEVLIEKRPQGKIHFFSNENTVEEASGKLQMVMKTAYGIFLHVENQNPVRLDKIITILGKPGPAYEAYDRFANVCLTCEDLGQF